MNYKVPEVLIIDLDEDIRVLVTRQIAQTLPGTTVHAAADLDEARKHLVAHEMIRIIAIGSLVRGQGPITDETLQFIAAHTYRHSANVVIGATSIPEHAELLLKAGCSSPIVTNKEKWYVPICKSLSAYMQALENF
jgi:hypothetical protein